MVLCPYSGTITLAFQVDFKEFIVAAMKVLDSPEVEMVFLAGWMIRGSRNLWLFERKMQPADRIWYTVEFL